MTPDKISPSSEAEVRAELKALLRRAYDSDLEIEGGWDCRNGTEYPDWDVIITEVRKNEEPESPSTNE
ncbi:hypothetical protein [Natrinema versiforme]|uniref:Uncharacterized protein n=1 Tax=Natrinema versiforme JCM 10478 TaxID=1227496 RepID=L9XW84_9EURY|nr:hypothetical protein [Natrinema versiforme]ELY65691.1 hypothetical protein C489_14015 [Natrinema versiforme JCM 10478]